MDPAAAGDVQAFIVRLDEQLGSHYSLGMNIIQILLQTESVHADHGLRESIKHGRVGLQMDITVGTQKLLIQAEESGMGESFLRPRDAQLRVGESEPDLAHLFRREIFRDLVDLRAQEGHIR